MGRGRGCGGLLLAAVLVGSAATAETLHVGAASSLREVVDALATRFETESEALVRASYGASSVLAAQLRAGAPLDVLLLADPRIAQALQRDSEVTLGAVFARNRLVVLVRDPEIEIPSPDALLDPRYRRIAIPSEAVPVGRYAREWLARHELLEALLPRAVQTEHARATLLAVDQGHVDVAIVYETDARLARHAVVGYRIPDDAQPHIEYVALLSPRARDSELAERWLRFMGSAQVREILEAAGFGAVPAPEAS